MTLKRMAVCSVKGSSVPLWKKVWSLPENGNKVFSLPNNKKKVCLIFKRFLKGFQLGLKKFFSSFLEKSLVTS